MASDGAPHLGSRSSSASSVPGPGASDTERRITLLREALAASPEDPKLHLEMAEVLLATEPALAVDHANVALDLGDVAGDDGPRMAIVLGEALLACGACDDALALADACAPRWPRMAALAWIEARARRARGEPELAMAALERCLAVGDDPSLPLATGAGTFLAAHELGLWAETMNDRVLGRMLHTRALPHPPAAARLAALSSPRLGPPPPRAFERSGIAMKDTRHGPMMYFANDLFVGRSLDRYGEWCEAELDLLRPILTAGDVVVDVGANVGTHTVAFGAAVGPSGKVIAIEPQGRVHDLLTANAAANGLRQVSCLRAAAGASVGTVRIRTIDVEQASNVGGVAVDTAHTEGDAGAGEEVPMVTIDSLELASCKLLKVDVEGLEVAVLTGAAATIARCQPVLFVENDTVERSPELLAAVRGLGYDAYWHVARYYRPDNWFAGAEDVFAAYQPQANLVCVPGGTRPACVQGLEPVRGETDDFVQAMKRGALGATLLRTPLAPVSPAMTAVSVAVPPTPAPAATPARARRPLTVVACIPGREFSGRFFDAWHAFADRCREEGVRLILSRTYDAVVYYARNKVAGGDTRRGPSQAPWGGEVDYDYMLWIDSDVIFRFEDFQALLRHKVDIAAGLYVMADGQRFAAVETMDEAAFARDGHFTFLTPEITATKAGPFPVDYCGFGFMLVRKGVFERLAYPWFRPLWLEMPGGVSEFTSEDVGFCLQAKKAGLRVLVDPTVVVGHEKATVLLPPAPPVLRPKAA